MADPVEEAFAVLTDRTIEDFLARMRAGNILQNALNAGGSGEVPAPGTPGTPGDRQAGIEPFRRVRDALGLGGNDEDWDSLIQTIRWRMDALEKLMALNNRLAGALNDALTNEFEWFVEAEAAVAANAAALRGSGEPPEGSGGKG